MPLRQGEDIAVLAPLNGANAGRHRQRAARLRRLRRRPRRSATGTISRARTSTARSLVVLINDPDFEGGEGDFGGKAMTYYGRWTYKYEEAARRGAAGVMIVHETEPASYGWNTVKNSNTNAQFDIVRQNPRRAHTPFESWIQRAARRADVPALRPQFRRRPRPPPSAATSSRSR